MRMLQKVFNFAQQLANLIIKLELEGHGLKFLVTRDYHRLASHWLHISALVQATGSLKLGKYIGYSFASTISAEC